MYQYTYDAVLADSPVDARAQERAAFDQAIALLRSAGRGGGLSAQAEAIDFTVRLWSLLIKDLASDENDLPRELRANLMSVGLWVMGEARRVETGQSNGLGAIADVCQIIRDGLN